MVLVYIRHIFSASFSGSEFNVIDINRARECGVAARPPSSPLQFNIAISYQPLRVEAS